MVDYIYAIKYQKKIKGLIQCSELLGFRVEDLLLQYSDSIFVNSEVSKYELFSTIIEDSKVNEVQADYLSSQLLELKSFKDRRNQYEYGLDLILGWLVEDCVLKYLSSKGVKCRLSGGDANREFLDSNQISTDPDIYITKCGIEFPLEVICDWTGYWFRNNSLELRYNKYKDLAKSKSILIGISISDQKGLLMTFNEKDSSSWVKIPSHVAFGGKPAYSLKKSKLKLESLQSVLDELVSVCSGQQLK